MLLLHACCASCTLSFVKSVQKERDFDPSQIEIYFYNPNIHPRSEYFARQKALKIVMNDTGIKLHFPNYVPREYFDSLRGVRSALREKIWDKRVRCPQCWLLRLTRAFEFARNNNFDEVGSTLVTSGYMDQDNVRLIAQSLSKKFKIPFYTPETIECDHKACGFYKQNYCGCMYSLIEKNEEKFFG